MAFSRYAITGQMVLQKKDKHNRIWTTSIALTGLTIEASCKENAEALYRQLIEDVTIPINNPEDVKITELNISAVEL